MIHIGVYNELIVDRILAPGAFLIDNKGNDVLLPNKYIPVGVKIGDQLKVFIYNDSEDRTVATTLRPLLQLHEFGYLKVKDVNNIGAFLDWGLEKDLLVPFRQQHKRLNIGQWCLVYLYIDTLTHRLAATTKVDKHFEKENIELEVNQEVNLLITNESDLGVNVIINNTYSGMIFRNQIYKDIMIGDHMKGFIEQVRSDGKIDVSLRKKGMKNLEAGAQTILDELRASNGFIELTDKSTPEEIQSILQMSKKNFKKSLGILYRNKQVLIKKEGVLLRKIEEK
tara:strand:- start:1099 stop:1944 length:846 start_codon:yes stop_codon:yes gene_type:complete